MRSEARPRLYEKARGALSLGMSPARSSRSAAILGLLTSAAGCALLVWIVRRVGTRDVVAGLRQVGAGFLVMLALAQHGLQARQHIGGNGRGHGVSLAQTHPPNHSCHPTNPAARLSRSLIASPRPVSGIGATAMPLAPSARSAARR